MSRPKYDPMARAAAAWGEPVPDWIAALARACASSSATKVAAKLGISDATVSQTLGNSYKGDMAGIEARVRGVYLDGKVACPAMGELSSKDCEDWQRSAQRWTPGNPTRTAMYRACRRCPRFTEEPVT